MVVTMPYGFRRSFVLLFMLPPLFVLINSAQSREAPQALIIPDQTPAPKRGMSVDDQMNIRRMLRSYVSPDGQSVLFELAQADVPNNSYRMAWFVAPTIPNAKAQYLADSGPAYIARAPSGALQGGLLPRPAAWSPDGRWVAFVRDRNGAAQIWRILGSGERAEQVTHSAADVMEFAWSADAKSILYSVGRDREIMLAKEERLRGYLYDERIDPGYPTELMWSPCVSNFLSSETRPCEPTIWIADLSSGAERRATKEEMEQFAVLKGWKLYAQRDEADKRLVTPSPNGKRLAWIGNVDPKIYVGHRPPMAIFATDGAEKKKIHRCNYRECQGEITNLWWNVAATEIIFRRLEGHSRSVTSFHAWQPGGGRPRKIYASNSFFTSCGMGRDELICQREDWTRPAYLVGIELVDGSMKTIINPNPEFDNFKFPKIEKLEWTGEDGSEAFAQFVYPTNYRSGVRYPLIVVSYSCPGYLRDVGDENAIFALAQQGFAVLCYWLPTGNAASKIADPKKAVAIQWGRSMVAPLLWMLNQLDERELIDPNNVGVSGISNGATLVDKIILSGDRRFTAASAGYTNHPAKYHLFTRQGRELLRVAGSGDPYTGAGFEKWKASSPGMNAERIVTPLLLNVADHEATRGAAGFASLQDAGKPVEMYVYPNEGHYKTQPAHKYHIYRRNMQWFLFWMQNKEVTDPVDPDQYMRWKKLRALQCKDPDGIHTYCSPVARIN